MNNYSTIQERVRMIVDRFYNGNITAMAKATFISRTTINSIIGEKEASPGYEVIKRIADTSSINISLDWLITGKGEMLKADSYHNNDSGIVSEDNIKLNISMNEKDKMISILLEKIENLESENAELRLKLNSSEESLAV